MRLRVLAEAEADLTSIKAYIGHDSRTAALRVIRRLRRSARQLATAPLIGRSGRLQGTREWAVPGLPYLIVYRVNEAEREVVVIAVFHGAQNRPS